MGARAGAAVSTEGQTGRRSTSQTNSHGCSQDLVLMSCWTEGLISSLAIGQRLPTFFVHRAAQNMALFSLRESVYVRKSGD